jgi:hypothetical protein
LSSVTVVIAFIIIVILAFIIIIAGLRVLP